MFLVDPSTWSPYLQEAVKSEDIGVVEYDLKLDYEYWTYRTYVEISKERTRTRLIILS